MSRHPYFEIAAMLEADLREQRRHDRLGDGVTLFASEDEEAAARHRARELRYLGRRDLDAGTYPPPDDD